MLCVWEDTNIYAHADLARRLRDPARSTVELSPNGLVLVHQEPGLMMAPHWHAQVEINYVFRGAVRYRLHHHSTDLNAGEMGIFWGGLPHQMVDAEQDTLFIAIHLPLGHFFRLHLAAELTRKLRRGGMIVIDDPTGNDEGNFNRWSNFIHSGDPARIEHAINELLLRIDRIQFEPFRLSEARQHETGASGTVEPSQFGSVRKICEFVADNFCEDIDMSDIASSANVHPKTAMRLFKQSTGMTLYKYLSLLRLSFAQALLMTDEMSIIDVAMECGFGSLGAFNTSFAKLAGKSPTQFRRDCRMLPGAFR